jgi:hypothetical protein
VPPRRVEGAALDVPLPFVPAVGSMFEVSESGFDGILQVKTVTWKIRKNKFRHLLI